MYTYQQYSNKLAEHVASILNFKVNTGSPLPNFIKHLEPNQQVEKLLIALSKSKYTGEVHMLMQYDMDSINSLNNYYKLEEIVDNYLQPVIIEEQNINSSLNIIEGLSRQDIELEYSNAMANLTQYQILDYFNSQSNSLLKHLKTSSYEHKVLKSLKNDILDILKNPGLTNQQKLDNISQKFDTFKQDCDTNSNKSYVGQIYKAFYKLVTMVLTRLGITSQKPSLDNELQSVHKGLFNLYSANSFVDVNKVSGSVDNHELISQYSKPQGKTF